MRHTQKNFCRVIIQHNLPHGLRTPNEGINQRYLKNWGVATWQTNYAFAVPKKLRVGVNFRSCMLFPLWASVVHDFAHEKLSCSPDCPPKWPKHRTPYLKIGPPTNC